MTSVAEPTQAVRCLVVEDSEADVRLIERELRRGGIAAELTRVETAEEMTRALAGGEWDIIFSDWEMPRFSALAAMTIARQRAQGVPLIIVSGTIVEEAAVDALKGGAADFVRKDRLARLVPAVERELREARHRLAGRDAEARLALERRAREVEERYRRWLDSIPPLAWRCDAGGAVLECNQRWLDYTGMTGETVRGEGWLAALHPDDRVRAARQLAADLAAGRAFECEYRVRRAADGTYRRHLARALPETRDGEGAGTWTGTATDIEDQKRAEEALRESKERLAVTLRSIGDAVVATDAAGCVTLMNRVAETLTGWTAADAAGHPLQQVLRIVDEDTRAPAESPVERVLREGAIVGLGNHTALLSRDGTERPIADSAAPMRSSGGEIVGVVLVFRDQTEERARERAVRRSEEALREADRRKDEFLATLSHELRNPLAPIRNSIHVLQHSRPDDARAGRARETIDRQTQHLTRLVDDLLDVTRIARGKIELRRARVDLRRLVLQSAEDFRATMDERRVGFRVEVPDGEVWAGVDAARVTQVVGNLLQNAAKFTNQGGQVALSLTATGEQARISVSDNGTGIEPALVPRIFDPFFQGDRTRARSGGLGLGLALVKGIAELHGGAVQVESAGIGAGARFVVTLPLGGPVESQERSRAGEQGTTRPRRVLVVDDNRDAARSMADLLELLGHAAEVAFDGPSAVEKARAHRPDVVLCDLGLPGMSGYEVARALRASAARVWLFAVSGYAQAEDVNRAFQAGFDGHIAKPASAEDIERLLGPVGT